MKKKPYSQMTFAELEAELDLHDHDGTDTALITQELARRRANSTDRLPDEAHGLESAEAKRRKEERLADLKSLRDCAERIRRGESLSAQQLANILLETGESTGSQKKEEKPDRNHWSLVRAREEEGQPDRRRMSQAAKAKAYRRFKKL